MNLEPASAFHVLLVEDNPGDVRLTREALKEGRIHCHLTVAHDGEEALALLRPEKQDAGVRLPDLILLDLNLPKLDGMEVLKEIKNDPRLRHIPVIIMTISSSERDIVKGYDLSANCFVTKPMDPEEFLVVVRTIRAFWLTVVRLPDNDVGR